MSIKPVYIAKDLVVLPARTEGKQVLMGMRRKPNGEWTDFRSSHLVRVDADEGEYETLNSVYMDESMFTNEKVIPNDSSEENQLPRS